MKSLLLKKIEEINKIIIDRDSNLNFGLLGGSIGEILFLFYYADLTGNKQNIAIASKRIEKTIETINSSNNVLFSFGGGLSGVLWALDHLKKHEFIYFNENNFNDYDSLIIKLMNELIENGLYDYLHESLGMCLLFISREKNITDIHNFIKTLSSIKINCESNRGIGWEYHLRSVNMMVINLGLSHGLASIIAILSKVYKVTGNFLVKELINDSITCLLFSKKPWKNNSLFPNHVFKNAIPISVKSKNSRLAWCYGDLGISVALWHASQAMERKDWEKEAKKIMLHSAKRIDLDQNGVIDAGLCHGTAGIAHIFNRMHGYTGLPELKEASDYWFEQTLKMAKFEDGLAGYKAWHGDMGWKNEAGLLEGIAGIGLALISAVSDIEPAWDECLLLS